MKPHILSKRRLESREQRTSCDFVAKPKESVFGLGVAPPIIETAGYGRWHPKADRGEAGTMCCICRSITARGRSRESQVKTREESSE